MIGLKNLPIILLRTALKDIASIKDVSTFIVE